MKADFPEGEEWVQVAFGGDLVAFLVDSKPIEASFGGCIWVLLDGGRRAAGVFHARTSALPTPSSRGVHGTSANCQLRSI